MPQSAEHMAQQLRDAGCSETFIAEFLRALAEGSRLEQRQLLDRQRGEFLSRLHTQQRQLEYLDLLRFQLRNEQD